MARFVLAFSILLYSSICFCQTAEMLSMGNTLAGRTGANALFGNQAGLAELESTSFIVSTERRFSLSALSNHNAGAAIATNAGTIGLAINYFGFSEFNEQVIGLSYARALGEKFNIGAQIDYIGTRIRDFGNINTYTFELGILANVNNQLDIGAHFFNPLDVDRGIEDEPLESILSVGFAYRASKKFTLMADVEAELDFDPRYKLGIDYALNELLNLRFGAFTEPVTLSFGIGLKIKSQLFIDFASTYQTILGISPGLGVRYVLNSKQ